jgi:hypothetical protein
MTSPNFTVQLHLGDGIGVRLLFFARKLPIPSSERSAQEPGVTASALHEELVTMTFQMRGGFMQQERSVICASIDIGSNTIHLLVARCTRATLDILETKTELVRIEESVTKTGEISQDKCDAVLWAR